MPDLFLSLYRFELSPGQSAQMPGAGLAAVLAHHGTLSVGGETVGSGAATRAPGQAEVSAQGADRATALVFVLSDRPAEAGALLSERLEVSVPCLLRLDEVAFPPGAVAYRHVHAGAGLRHLRWGHLVLEADDHAFEAHPGDTWFEGAGSPVRATATQDAPETRFARCMVIPPDYAGQPTIQILDPVDAARERRQVTHRHIDHLIEAWPHGDAG